MGNDRARLALFAGLLVLVAVAAAPSARALEDWGVQIPHLQEVGGCDGLHHATGFTNSPFHWDFKSAG
jgi:hypothetical protein